MVRFKRVGSPDVEPPQYEADGAAGLDLRADVLAMHETLPIGVQRVGDGLRLYPGARVSIPFGFAFEFPDGWEGQVRGRYEWQQRRLDTLFGTIESEHRGVVRATVDYCGAEPIEIRHGDRIAQMVIAAVPQARLDEATELATRARGAGGRTAFGFGRVTLRDAATDEPVDGTPPDPHEERVSDHAATQAAHALGTTIDSARAQLVAAAAHASFVERFADGAELWQAGEVRFVAVPSISGAMRIVSACFGEQPLRRGANGTLYVTDYAVRRFHARIRPDLDITAARSRLVELVAAGRYRGPYNGRSLRETLVRPELWRGPRTGTDGDGFADSRIRFVVSHGTGELPQVVTVLPSRRALVGRGSL